MNFKSITYGRTGYLIHRQRRESAGGSVDIGRSGGLWIEKLDVRLFHLSNTEFTQFILHYRKT